MPGVVKSSRAPLALRRLGHRCHGPSGTERLIDSGVEGPGPGPRARGPGPGKGPADYNIFGRG